MDLYIGESQHIWQHKTQFCNIASYEEVLELYHMNAGPNMGIILFVA